LKKTNLNADILGPTINTKKAKKKLTPASTSSKIFRKRTKANSNSKSEALQNSLPARRTKLDDKASSSESELLGEHGRTAWIRTRSTTVT
jgi:hypothetical protein